MTVLRGDCVELMKAMPDCSVDSIVTDPPYGLEFMGKDWDAPWKASGTVEVVTEGQDKSHPYRDGSKRVRYGTSDMPAFQQWFEMVAVECLRVLKPGGHLLAFGGTRTYHRMACAIEDAGFEIRDSIHWVYGSGFPKSLNVGKAIDKLDAAQEQQARRYRFTEWVRSTGLTAKRIDEATGTFMGHHYTTHPTQPAIMTVEHLDAVRHLIGEVPEWVEAECRKRSVESKNFASREVIAKGYRVDNKTSAVPIGGATPEGHYDITAPATEEAAQWEGWGTALKPAHEPIVVARKPLESTVAGNVLVWGTGGLNVDGCRVGTDGGGTNCSHWPEPCRGHESAGGAYASNHGAPRDAPSGRWPANVVFDRTAGEALDQQSGVSASKVGERPGARGRSEAWTRPAHADYEPEVRGHSDSGGASRFFTQADFGPDDWPFVYQAKPSRRERNAGLDGMPEQQIRRHSGGEYAHNSGSTASSKNGGASNNHHPTVKPVALMRHLVRLVTPPGGTVLDPFAGSGTTLVAAILEGLEPLGCEMTDEYLPIIEGRMAWAREQVAEPDQPTLL